MKKVVLIMAFATGMTGAYAQRTAKVEKTGNDTGGTADSEETGAISLSNKEDTRHSPSTGDLFDGLVRPVTFDRMAPPYALEMIPDKAVHLIFPAATKCVDLRSANILAGKADGLENMFRVKAASKDFSREANLAVITGDGSYYTFNVKYADGPAKLSVEMKDFIHGGEAMSQSNNSQEIYLTELGSESPLLVRLIMGSVYDNNKCLVKYIGCKRFGIQYILKGICTHDGLFYLHAELKSTFNVPFFADFVTFKMVDKKVAKRATIQEQVIVPLRAFNYVTTVDGKSKERTVFTLPKFILPDDKQLTVEMNEQNGGRYQRSILTSAELIRARVINELKVK